ncbi:MAG: hypothetical protein JKX95_06640 [Bacteroidia bacterium]|nr:hypothetical protein [Bacteroidia bacterium]
MLKFDLENKRFEKLVESDLTNEQILERYDFQTSILNSWETVKNNLNLPSAYLIGKEIKPHSSVKDSIDLLAFDPDDSSLIVIELKRNKNKLQLLQALSYAAMVATWDNDRLISEIQKDINPEPEELIDLINNNELNSEIKIILVSELYDPEVIITAEWLSSRYQVNITAFAVSLHKLDKQYFVNFEQRLPLKELADTYEVRGPRSKSARRAENINWEDVIPKLKYDFGRKAVELCLTEKEGDASRRRFVGFRSNYDGFDWISINFREKYLNIYLKGKSENAEQVLQDKFTSKIEISTWAEGFSFKLDKEKQFNELVKWLKIGGK